MRRAYWAHFSACRCIHCFTEVDAQITASDCKKTSYWEQMHILYLQKMPSVSGGHCKNYARVKAFSQGKSRVYKTSHYAQFVGKNQRRRNTSAFPREMLRHNDETISYFRILYPYVRCHQPACLRFAKASSRSQRWALHWAAHPKVQHSPFADTQSDAKKLSLLPSAGWEISTYPPMGRGDAKNSLVRSCVCHLSNRHRNQEKNWRGLGGLDPCTLKKRRHPLKTH